MKKILFLLLGLIYCFLSFGQEPYSQVIPPSPTAASLGQYGEYKVGGSSGVPSIGVPLFEVKGNTMSVPVSLSYHGAGNKVTSFASWVGLGWSLNAGGVVTRTVIGNADGAGNGINALYNQGLDPNDFNPLTDEDDYNFFRAIAKQRWTADPDLYSFNVMGVSGQFFLTPDGEIHLYSHQDLKIKRIAGIGVVDKFIITTGDGTVYEFAAKEYTSNVSIGCDDIGNSQYYVSSWYLTKINHQYEEFTFTYADENIIQGASKSFSESKKSSGNNGCPIYNYCESSQTSSTEKKKLASITGPFGTAIFTATKPRIDLNGGTALETIQYQDITVNFETEFIESFGSGWNTQDDHNKYRMFLNSVGLETNSETPQLYQFRYNSKKLPRRDSYNIDHYGYFGASNTTLLPKQELYPNLFPTGANREVIEDNVKAGILEEIIYPTKGSTRFDWESNKITDTDYHVVQKPKVASIYDDRSYIQETYSTLFEIKENQQITFKHIVGKHWRVDEIGDIDVVIKNKSTNQVVFSGNLNRTGERKINLGIGNYELSAHNQGIHFEYLNLKIHYYESETVYTAETEYLGGLRIAKTSNVDFDGTTVLSTKSFSYSDPSVNNRVTDIDYTGQSFSYVIVDPQGLPKPDDRACWMLSRSSSSRYALSNSVSYKDITEYSGTPESNIGYVKYSYYTSRDKGGGVLGALLSDESWKRNLLRKSEAYNSDGEIVSKTVNEYEFIRRNSFTGLKVAFLKDDPTTEQFPPASTEELIYNTYTYTSEWAKLVSTTNTNYYGNDPVTTSVKNVYFKPESHVNVNKTVTTDSEGIEWTNVTLYPEDFSDTDELFTVLKDKYFGLPVQQVSYFKKDGQSAKTTSARTNIYNENGDVIEVYNAELEKPVDNALFLADGDGSTKLAFNLSINYPDVPNAEISYYEDGKIKEVKTRDLTSIYLWGYESRYPVAVISNISYNQVISLVGNSVINEIQDANDKSIIKQKLQTIKNVLPAKSFMEMNFYKIGVGQEEKLDVNNQKISYVYDEFNRLYQIKDHNGNILQQFEYNFSSNQ